MRIILIILRSKFRDLTHYFIFSESYIVQKENIMTFF